jgi:hypothetical protein
MVVMSCKKSFLKTVMLVWVLNQLLRESASGFFVGGGVHNKKIAVGDVLNIPCSVAGVLDEPFSYIKNLFP